MIAPASTGRDRRRRIVVIMAAHTNRGIRSRRRPFHRMLMTVVIKFREPRMEETPAR